MGMGVMSCVRLAVTAVSRKVLRRGRNHQRKG
jgi:hypothetical protein